MSSLTPQKTSAAFSIRSIEAVFDNIAFRFLFAKVVTAALSYAAMAVWFWDKLTYREHSFVILSAVYTVMGTWAFRSGRDTQARVFSVFLMCTAGAYSMSNILLFGSLVESLQFLTEIIARTRFEIFLPWYTWRFLKGFPSSYESPRFSVIRRSFQAASLILGTFYFSVGIIDFSMTILGVNRGDFPVAIWHLADNAWYSTMMLGFLGMVAVFYKMRGTKGEERRRTRLFAYSLVLGFGPQTAKTALELIIPPALSIFPSEPEGKRVVFFVINFLTLLMPFFSFYAVISNQVLDVKQIARKAIQRLLARYSATAIGLMPFILLISLLLRARDQALVDIFSGVQAIVLTGLTILGIVLMRFRRVIMDAIDRRFFRDRYNARIVLVELVEQVRGTRNLTELSNLVGQGVDLALHLERVSLLVSDSAHGRFVDPLDEIRPLDIASKLVTILQGSREALIVDFGDHGSPLHDLEAGEKHWLVDGHVEMLSPAHALDGTMIGILVLGRKKSEEPFVLEDKDLVKSVCSSTGLVIELLQLKERTPTPRVHPAADSSASLGIGSSSSKGEWVEAEVAARECMTCSRVFPASESRCLACQVDLEPAVVPYVLHGQYRFESRLGMGGMAVVYRATDLRLGREVAIKTLPRVSPEAAMRLHREARTAATVTDPGLAAIYGIETWEGMPLLVQEYLQGGTLSDQLMSGEPLDPLLAIDMGKTVALALKKIHSAGILHRDLKPSNIGYTQDGQAKLLDFGVARIHHDLRQDAETGSGELLDSKSRIQNTASWVIGRTATGQLVGTIGYLSPEAVLGHRPELSVDLWALNVVLWESLAGVNLFTGKSFQKVLEKIRDAKVAKLRDYMPDCPQPVVDFFAVELNRDKMKRARSGVELHERLENLQRLLVG